MIVDLLLNILIPFEVFLCRHLSMTAYNHAPKDINRSAFSIFFNSFLPASYLLQLRFFPVHCFIQLLFLQFPLAEAVVVFSGYCHCASRALAVFLQFDCFSPLPPLLKNRLFLCLSRSLYCLAVSISLPGETSWPQSSSILPATLLQEPPLLSPSFFAGSLTTSGETRNNQGPSNLP